MEQIWVERLVEEKDQWVWKAQPETLDTERDFSIDEDNLNQDICRTGHLLVRYGTLAAEQTANLRRKEEYVKLVKAQVAAALRSEAEKKGEKLTESKLEERVVVHENYQQALGELHVMRADALKCDHWYRAAIKRAELLNALAFRQGAEIKRMPG